MALPLPDCEPDDARDAVHPTCVHGQDLSKARIPVYARAVIEALRFDGTGDAGLRSLGEEEWDHLLKFSDAAQLTLTLGHVCGDALPEWVRRRVSLNLLTYSEKYERLEGYLLEIAAALEKCGIEYAILKGASHCPDFTPDPLLRAQGDIDIWCRLEDVEAGRDVLSQLGYLPLPHSEDRHLPPMIRDTTWQWRGDYFASDLPIAVELHYRLWDERQEHIPAPRESDFWNRRTTASVHGRTLPVLALPDTLAFAALHLLMHILHGDLRMQRAWEIAHFLHEHASDDSFWSAWRQSHVASLRQAQTVVLALTAGWFGVPLPPVVQDEADALPSDVKLWLERYALSPIEALFHPNKDEVWLQLCLVDSLRGKLSVLRRRLVPLKVPARVDESTARRATPTAEQRKRYVARIASRAAHHVRALAPALWTGLKFFSARQGLGAGFVRFQTSSTLFSFGVMTFLLLYNLYLLGLGLHEDAIGRIAGCLTLGTLAGALPAAALARRFGLRAAMLAGILGSAGAMLLRVTAARNEPWLLATALLNGLFLSLWTTSFSPAVAGLTRERARQFAFSIVCSLGMATGILAGLVGGRLPGWLGRFAGSPGNLQPKRVALLAAAGITLLAMLPALRLRFTQSSAPAVSQRSRNAWLRALFIPLAFWSAAVGAFNPFFNTFFSERLRMNVEHVGSVFALSQLVQVCAVLAAPAILRRLGEVRGIASMQLATGFTLAILSVAPGGTAAAAVYICYMSLQYMSEPGILSMLMGGVRETDRSAVSAVYFLVTSVAGSAAAVAGGWAIARFGYPPLLLAAGLVAALAALLFRMLIDEERPAVVPSISTSE